MTNFFPFCTIGISMYQKRILPYFIIPSTFSPQASSSLEHYRRTEGQRHFFTPSYLSSFFSLSARGPTRRRNSTGLAELWGGWPNELVLYVILYVCICWALSTMLPKTTCPSKYSEWSPCLLHRGFQRCIDFEQSLLKPTYIVLGVIFGFVTICSTNFYRKKT